MIELKACIACGLEKPLSAFVKRSGGGGRRGTCRTCLRRRKRDEAPPAEAGARAAEAPALAAVAATGAESRTNARTAAVSAVATAAASAATAVHAARADAQSSPSLSATEPAAVPVEDSDAAAAAAVPKPGRKRRRRKKKQADLRREDKLDEADVLTLAGASGELDDEAVEERAGKALDAALDTEQAAEVSAISPKRKRNRRRNRKKHTELRRQDAPEAEAAAANARLDAAAHASLAADADEAQPEDGGPEAADAPHGGQLALNGETDRDPAASPRKRKRKRRRGRGKSTKRKPAAEAGADTEETAAVRPPNRVIVPVKGNFSFKTSLLNDRGRGMIRLRGKRETGKRWSTEIPMDMAVRMVEEGAAGIIHPGLIHKLYTKADFRLLVLQRDDYICRYCGNFGDTIDHVMPKSKGGLSTPANCVCACAECNLKKADSLDYVDDEVLQQFL